MDKVKDFLSKLKEALDKNPIIKRMAIIMGVFILLIILIVIISSCARRAKPKYYTYKDFEKYMITLVKNRYKDKEDELPKNDKEELIVELKSFVNDGTIEDLTELIENNSTCNGTVRVVNNYGNLLYIPYLDCGKDYKTKTILEVLTDEENIVTEGNGLYKVEDEYIYKGEVTNNYLKLNDILFKVLRINSDGTIRVMDITSKFRNIIWDNRYNVSRKANDGINDFIQDNNVNSRLKDTLEDIYENNEVYNSSNYKTFFVSKEICIGKRSVEDNIFDPNVECSEKTDPYPIGLLYPYEYYQASLDPNCETIESKSCKNYNYLSILERTTWTTIADKDSNYKSYKISDDGSYLSITKNESSLLIVTTLDKDLLYKGGTGTNTDPYIIETYAIEKSTKKK